MLSSVESWVSLHQTHFVIFRNSLAVYHMSDCLFFLILGEMQEGFQHSVSFSLRLPANGMSEAGKDVKS